jgi:hypothetical protein
MLFKNSEVFPRRFSAKDITSSFEVKVYPVANNSGKTIKSAFKLLTNFLISLKFCSISPKTGFD